MLSHLHAANKLTTGMFAIPEHLEMKWVPASAEKAKAGMVHSVSGWTWGVQVKLWDPLRIRAIPERLRGVFTTRCYMNPHLPLPLLGSLDTAHWPLTFDELGRRCGVGQVWPRLIDAVVQVVTPCAAWRWQRLMIRSTWKQWTWRTRPSLWNTRWEHENLSGYKIAIQSRSKYTFSDCEFQLLSPNLSGYRIAIWLSKAGQNIHF